MLPLTASSPRLRLDIVLNDLVASAFTTGEIYIKSDGTPWRPIVHIRDIIGAVVAVLDAPREAVHNQTFNVGRNDENFRIRELAEIVAEVVPGCRVEYAPGGGPDLRCYRVSFDKINRLVPGFPPAVDRAQGRTGTLRRVSRCWAHRSRYGAGALRPHQRNPAPAAGRKAGRRLALDQQSSRSDSERALKDRQQ